MSLKEGEPEIFLFTTEFPFGKGEQFLEAEVRILSTFTDKITVVPRIIHGEQRELPDNIKLDLTFAQSFPSTGKKVFDINRLKVYRFALQYESPKNIFKAFNFLRTIRAAYNAEKAGEWASHKFKKHKGKIIFYSYWLEFYTFGLCLYAYKNKNIKVVSRVHNYDLYEFRYPNNYIPFREKTLELIDGVFSISVNGKDYLGKKYPRYIRKFSFLPLGTFDSGMNKENSGKTGIHILSCSLLNEVKRVPLIIKSIYALAEENPDQEIEWTHIGGGPLMEEIKSLVQANKYQNLKINLEGQQSNSYVFQFYKNNRIDTFINVSSVEGIPVSIMEAQSFGIPVIATAVGGTPEIVNKENGILLSANPTVDEIKEAVKKFTNSQFQQQKRVKSRENWNIKFNAEKNYKEFYKKISQLH